MKPDRAKRIMDALQVASGEYISAAEDEMKARGSVHNIYLIVREAYSLQGKARNLSRRWGIDPCNCA